MWLIGRREDQLAEPDCSVNMIDAKMAMRLLMDTLPCK
jgi:hypothetical protein